MKKKSAQLLIAAVLILVLNSTTSPTATLSTYPNSSSGTASVGTDVILQQGNSLPKFALMAKQSSQLVSDPRVGTGAYSSFWQSDLPFWKGILRGFTNLGVKRVDTSLPEVEEPISWDWPEDEFPQEYDLFIDGLIDNGVTVNYLIHFWDKAGHALGEELSTPRFKTEEQTQDFLDYVRLVVSHYKGRVQYYTIWSEPDNCGGDQVKCIEVNDYINLVRQTAPVIREVDPQAKVSIAPNVLFFARDYLFALLESDIMTMVDVIQWHGIYDVLPNSQFYGNYYYEYPSLIQEIKQTASAHGFSGEFWGTELTWCSEEFPDCHPPDQPWGQATTDIQAAKYYTRAIPMHLSMDMGIGVKTFEQPNTPWTYPTIQNLFTVMAGTTPTSLTVQVESEATDIMSYGFTLSNGDVMFILWTNGEAVDDDPGVRTKLTFPCLSAQKVVGIDVLNGFEQELITTGEDSNVVINDLLLRDYALIVRFSSEIRTSVQSDDIAIPTKYRLQQNFPNPFNPTTIINYDVSSAGQVELKIYNTLGQTIRTLVNSTQPVGAHQTTWDGRDNNSNVVPSGVYFYQLQAGSVVETRKMVFMR